MDFTDLYQQVILDHNRSPRNFGELADATHHADGHNPLCGDRLTLSDVRAFTTLLRFDPVYFTHFKCDKKRLREYPNVWGFTLELAQMPAVRPTIDVPQIKFHYFHSHSRLNPRGVVPKGPDIDWELPHGRDRQYGQ